SATSPAPPVSAAWAGIATPTARAAITAVNLFIKRPPARPPGSKARERPPPAAAKRHRLQTQTPHKRAARQRQPNDRTQPPRSGPSRPSVNELQRSGHQD